MAINEERSYTEYNVEVPTTDFPIGFDILDDGIDVVAVTLNDVDPTTLGYTVIQVNNTTYRFAPAVPSGVVRLTRMTDIDQMAHVFTEGAIFISENMDGNFKQIRHAQQEVRDGFNKLSVDTHEIIDTLQVVGKAAQDAAAAAEAAAQTANDAAAQVNAKVSYQDLDNAVEVAVRSNTAYFYPTVAQMVAATNLTDGGVVATKGYHNAADKGGATYLISSVATGYSIPLINGLHAVLKDSFDIRKFGIVDDPTLDQSDELTRMSIYADLYSYEIDFLNFKLMTPKTVRDITFRNSKVRGLYFTKPHKLKNLYVTHDKTQQLVQGHSCITFSFSDRFGIGEIAAENVTLDPYVADHLLLNGEGDGYLFGIVVRWETAYLLTLGISHDVYLTDYEINFKNIKFLSTAVSYNLFSQIKTRNAYLENASGDHMAIFFVSNAYNTYLSNVHTVHRDDMRIASGRKLGVALLHYEPEITGSSVTYGDIVMANCSTRDSSGALGVVFYQHKIPNCSIKVENYTFKNCVGRIGNAAQENDGMSDIYEIMETLTIDNIYIENCNGGYDFYSYIKNMVIVDQNGYTPFEARIRHVDKFNVIGTLNMPFFFAYGHTRVGELNIDTLIVNDPAYGFVNNLETVTIDHIKIKKVIANSPRLIKCKFSTLSIDEMIISDSIQLLNGMILTNNQAIIKLSNIKMLANMEGSLVAGNDASFVTISDSDINPNLVANGILTVNRCTLRFRSLYAGRTVAANTQVALGGTFSKGIKLGQIADVSLDKPQGGTRLFAQVDVDGRVDAYQVNASSVPVIIESGVLAFSVKTE